VKVEIPTGKYIVAVSGGVDSMALLDMLRENSSLELVVAHFNHGIRPDSTEDEKLVVKTAKKYGLSVEVGSGKLGANASEDLARQRRYNFLNSVARNYKASKIITAHHQDDLIETALLNILRGTGPRGLVSIADNPNILRPLLKTSKKSLVNYAKANNLEWREDGSNKDTRYLRNYLRQQVLPNLTDEQRKHLLNNIEKIAERQKEKDYLIATLSRNLIKQNTLNRDKFRLLPTDVASELLLNWLRNMEAKDLDKKTIDRLNIALRTGQTGTKHPVKDDLWLNLHIKTAQLTKTS
jgi:tRNA(Ile)-lysidine synthase